MSFKRMAGYAGITYVVLAVVTFILQGSPPSVDALAPELADYIAETGSAFKAAIALSAISTVAERPARTPATRRSSTSCSRPAR